MIKWFLLLVAIALAAGGWFYRDQVSDFYRHKFQNGNSPVASVLALAAPATPHPATDSVMQARKTYPALAVPNSPFNRRFVELYNNAKQTNPKLLTQPDWPMLLATQTASELAASAPTVTGPPPTEVSGSSLNARPAGSVPGYTVPPSVQLPGLKGSALDQRPAQRPPSH